MTSSTSVRIDARFRGPSNSGNGGYAAGLVASALGGSGCVVTLMKPPPLDMELRLESDGVGASLFSGEELIATAAGAALDIRVPEPPPFAAAAAAEARFTRFRDHIFPGCFVCGPEREAGDAMRIFPGRIDDSGVAATWLPDASLADEHGLVLPEFVWAALDCPGYFAIEAAAGLAVLGRLGVVLHRAVPAGAQVIVTGWPISSEGRKHSVGTALHDQAGGLLAAGLGTWISVGKHSGAAGKSSG